MSFFNTIMQRYTARKFKKHDWRIIESIPFLTFEKLIVNYVENGWEIADDYRVLNEDAKQWQCSLRKGTSILVCSWSAKALGNVVGPARPVEGLGAELGLPVYDQPQ